MKTKKVKQIKLPKIKYESESIDDRAVTEVVRNKDGMWESINIRTGLPERVLDESKKANKNRES
jgi:hypothetical protein